MGLRTGRKAGTECGRLSRLRLRKGSTVEGTSGAADQTTFREDVWEATLRYIMRQCDVPGGLIRKRPTHRTVAQRQRFPDDTGHQLATGGVRVKQVGVKPPRRAVAFVVVVEFGATQPLGWENSAGGVSQEASSPAVVGGLLLPTWGLADSRVCLGIVSVAEANKRHVARSAPANNRVSRGSSAQ
jgi:hypothetical protein